jgi:hypothetical protein
VVRQVCKGRWDHKAPKLRLGVTPMGAFWPNNRFKLNLNAS